MSLIIKHTRENLLTKSFKHVGGYEFKKSGPRGRNYRAEGDDPSDTILSYHTTGYVNSPTVYHFKDSYIGGFYQFDRKGYSWANSIIDAPEKLHEIDADYMAFCDWLKNHHISKNISKYRQPEQREFSENGYVLYIGQVHWDTTVKRSILGDYRTSVDTILTELSRTGVKVLYRNHPFAARTGCLLTNDDVAHLGNIRVMDSDVSIHDAIKNSIAVITINSGAGCEAMLHGKNVINAGVCDYGLVTNKWGSDSVINLIHREPDIDMYNRFLYFHVHENSVKMGRDLRKNVKRIKSFIGYHD